jgi:predicted kinase
MVIAGGQPGAGKTTVADLVQAALDRRGGAVRIGRDLYKVALAATGPGPSLPRGQPGLPLRVVAGVASAALQRNTHGNRRATEPLTGQECSASGCATGSQHFFTL